MLQPDCELLHLVLCYWLIGGRCRTGVSGPQRKSRRASGAGSVPETLLGSSGTHASFFGRLIDCLRDVETVLQPPLWCVL